MPVLCGVSLHFYMCCKAEAAAGTEQAEALSTIVSAVNDAMQKRMAQASQKLQVKIYYDD